LSERGPCTLLNLYARCPGWGAGLLIYLKELTNKLTINRPLLDMTEAMYRLQLMRDGRCQMVSVVTNCSVAV
jgi:hypothetical protein